MPPFWEDLSRSFSKAKMKQIHKREIIRNSLTFKLEKTDCEIPQGTSETVQGDSYTIKQLLEKSQQGLMPPVQKLGQYDENVTHDSDVRIEAPDFDLADAAAIKEEIQQKINNANEIKRKKHEAHQEKVLREKLDAELGSKSDDEGISQGDLATKSSGEGETKPTKK